MRYNLLSVVVPMYNEEGNATPLFNEIQKSCEDNIEKGLIKNYEVIFVDDGSRDGTWSEFERLKKKNARLKIVRLRHNSGQTAALRAGFDNSIGDIVATMDGDGQNDPKDILKLIEELNKGYDVVSGWRWQRNDPFFKRIFSKIMNKLRKNLIGDDLHDYGCSLKLYKRECLDDLQLYGELHRYITAYLYIKGYKIGEVKVNHRARKIGVTKYKFNRGLNGILDLFYLKFWAGYSTKPLHFFGRLGIYQWMLAVLICVEQIVKAIIIGKLNFGPLLALASMLVITGLLFIIFGFLSETMMRIYFKEKGSTYSVKQVI